MGAKRPRSPSCTRTTGGRGTGAKAPPIGATTSPLLGKVWRRVAQVPRVCQVPWPGIGVLRRPSQRAPAVRGGRGDRRALSAHLPGTASAVGA
eukprot:8877077-Lingulodinium_polyedra.AAC.1